MSKENGLDEIFITVDIKLLGDIHEVILSMQNEYIKQRLRFFWKLPFICNMTVHLIKLLFAPSSVVFNDKKQTMTVTQKVMLVSRYKNLSLILMKVRT